MPYNTSQVKPRRVRIDASSQCTLRCPCCPHTLGVIDGIYAPRKDGCDDPGVKDGLNPWAVHARNVVKKHVGSGHLSPEDFCRILDDNPWIRHVELSNWGEIFLNPRLAEIMECAHDRGVALTADSGVNLNAADDETLEALVKYGFLSMSCSITGGTAESYSRYRVGGDFNAVIGNIKKINAYKRKHGSKLPLLQWQYVMLSYNQGEIPLAKRLARDLGMYFYLQRNISSTYSPLTDDAALRGSVRGVPLTYREMYERQRTFKRQKDICAQLWHFPQVNWDGRLLGCCINYWDDFGSAFDEGLLAAINNRRMSYARGMLMGREAEDDAIPCSKCIFFRILRENGNWMTPIGVARTAAFHELKYRYFRTFKSIPLPRNYCI